jgi:hypothetical protein
MITSGIDALPFPVRESIIAKVRKFDSFTCDNDPRGEHDFGSFKQDGAVDVAPPG